VTPPIQLGSRGFVVRILQRRLRVHGGKDLAVTGIYDHVTDVAVRHFQYVHGLPVDGHVTPKMWRMLLHPAWRHHVHPTPKPPTIPFVKRTGIDYAWQKRPNFKTLRRLGFSFICRYLSHDPSKNITKDEADAARAAGLSVVLVWETTASRALANRAAGILDATEALKQATAIGFPSTRPIYFAVDFDTNGSPSWITEYFKGVQSVMGKKRTGMYGGIEAIKYGFDKGLISYGWQTYAWSGGKWDKRAQLRQVQNGITAAGISCDLDESAHTDFGQWT
jgi:peptidoglycan hydrolase-like protein with peptidoglycan-binding domain